MRPLFSCLLASSTLFIHTLSFALATPSSEQPLRIDRAEAVQYAWEYNLELAAARLLIEQAEARSLDAGRLENPILGLRSKSDFIDQNEGDHDLRVAFEQRFPVTDRLRREKDIAATEIKLAKAEVAQRELELAIEVARAYVLVAHREAEMGMREAMLEVTSALADFVASRVESAEASKIEVNRLRIARFREEQRIADLELDLERARARLAETMSLEPGRRIELKTPFGSEPIAEVPALDDDWLADHPAYRIRERLAELADGRFFLARAERWGDVAVELFIESEYEIGASGDSKRENIAGVQMKIPLPIHQQNRGEIEARRIRRHKTALRMEAVEQNLRRKAELQAVKTTHAIKHMRVFTDDVSELLDTNMAGMQRAYALGQIDFDALLLARRELLEIRSQQLELRAEYEAARIDWAAATGQIHLF